MLHVPPPQPQQHMAHPPTQPPPPLPSHLPHLTSVPPPNVPTQGTAGQHPGPRITNRHHHHQRVSAGGEHHQPIPAPRMPLQQQNSRKAASHHYVSNNMIGNGGMPSKLQQAPMGYPPKSLSYHQHHHPTHHGHPNTIVIPVVSAAGTGGSKTRMIPAHDPKTANKTHSNASSATNNTSSNTKGVHLAEPIQLSGGIPSSTTTGTVGTNTSNTSTTTGTGNVPVGGGGGGGGDSNGGGGTTTSTAILAPNADGSSDSIPKDSTSQQQQSMPLCVSETLANNKEKTPMCLVNELARFNKLQHQYRLTGESGPAHKKRFTVTLKLGDEEYTAEGASIKKAQHTAANEAVGKTKYKHPPAKTSRTKTGGKTSIGNITPTVELNALAMKRGEPTVYESEEVVVTPKYTHPPPGRPNAPQSGIGGGGHSYFPAPPPGTHYNCYHRNNGMYNNVPPTGVRYGAPQHQAYNRRNPMGGKMDYHSRGYYYNHMPHMPQSVPELYKVTLHVGERTFLGEGHTLQAARHDAASRALEVLKPLTPDANNAASECPDTSLDSDDPNCELKSPISLVHEMALKRKLSVQFEVLGEKGPPHMKVFTTLCRVGNIVTEGEGNGKKLSKKRAAEKMLEELRKLPPAAPEKSTSTLPKQKRKLPLPKRKTRNLIKDSGDEDPFDMVNPISRLMQIQQAQKEKEPVYTFLEERGLSRRREFIMEVTVGGKTATGIGPTKKLAKKEAAESLLAMLGHVRPPTANAYSPNKENISAGANEIAEKATRKVTFTDGSTGGTAGKQGGSAGRQIVPGVLQLNAGISNKSLSDLPTVRESAQETNSDTEAQSPEMTNSTRVASPTKPSAGVASTTVPPAVQNTAVNKNTPGSKPPTVGRMKEQLMYLAQLLKFEVLFSDFPKGNHGEYLTLVTLSTEPPQLCHGGGASLEESHDEAARGALDILSKIGLDNVTPKGNSSATDESKSKSAFTNGLK